MLHLKSFLILCPKYSKYPKFVILPHNYATTPPPPTASQNRHELDSRHHTQQNAHNYTVAATKKENYSAKVYSESFRPLNVEELDNMSSELSRDRLGQWAVESEAGIAGNLSGRDRLKSAKHNKVRNICL